MRSAAEIRSQLLHLRDINRLPLTYIADASRCSEFQLREALRLDGSEDTLRKLDAFLDAKHLHEVQKETKLLYRIEQLDNEMYRQYGAKNLHPKTYSKFSQPQQMRLLNAMDNRAKQLLADKVEKEHGFRPKFPDGFNYWQCKAKIRRRSETVRAED